MANELDDRAHKHTHTLAARGLKKNYGSRQVVKGVDLPLNLAKLSVFSAPTVLVKRRLSTWWWVLSLPTAVILN